MKPVIEFEDDEQSQRQNFRVKPHPQDPVKLKISGTEVTIVDISAKGVSFTYSGLLKGSDVPFQLAFKTDKVYVVSGQVTVVRKRKNEYSGHFGGIDEKDIAHIASLIIECQKRDIRRRKEQELENKSKS